MKQTAVEWFIQQLEKNYINQDIKNTVICIQAIEMEKKQIIDAQRYAISNADMNNNKGYFDCEKYYKETFKQD